jgi:glycosyltransferase involved in cell wall biosynthesis
VRILFVTHYFPPEVGAAQTRLLEWATDQSTRGHDVTVLTGFPNYPHGVVPAEYRGRWFQTERMGGLRVIRTAVYPAPNRGFARRLLNHTSFAVSAIAASLRIPRQDVVVVETPPLFTAAAGVAVARAKRAGMLLNVADYWPDLAIEHGILRNSAAIAGARWIERFAYRNAEAIAVPTPGLHRRLIARGLRPDHVVMLPHGVDPSRFTDRVDAAPVSRRIVYCGTIGMGHATRTLIEAARILEEGGGGYELIVVGDGPERAELESLTRTWALGSVTFVGRVPRERLPEMLTTAQVTVATQRALPLLTDALSTKVLEYMAAARPVVGAVSGWTAEVITRAQAGVVCPPERPEELAAAIAAVAADPARAAELGANGRRYVAANLTRERAGDRLEAALGAAARRRGARARRRGQLSRVR